MNQQNGLTFSTTCAATDGDCVAPLSSRARPGATVSMALISRQVEKILDPKRFTIRTEPTLLQKTSALRVMATGSDRSVSNQAVCQVDEAGRRNVQSIRYHSAGRVL
ncbi:non-homologous end-joining DNA ligase LigD [Pararhizobium qamdonense]|uniref:non-homologous end-joining DNA ligase LigD n=1 Tax=Pararhizobium qamdonense TaxID=3031126 RepID=UPI002E1D5889